MTAILLVAHAPLASSLLAVAQHAFGDCGGQVSAVDIAPDASLDDAKCQVAEALSRVGDSEVLILADAFGATPSNAALKVADGRRWRVVAGINVPMLWRTLCYGHLPLDDLVERAVDGGRQGIMQVAQTRPPNQSKGPPTDDPEPNPDQ